MKSIILFLLVALSFSAIAQPKTESVTVAGSASLAPKAKEVITPITVDLSEAELAKMKAFEDKFKSLDEETKLNLNSYVWFRNTLIETKKSLTLTPEDSISYVNGKFLLYRKSQPKN